MDLKKIKIDKLGLSLRAVNVLYRVGRITVDDIVNITESDLISLDQAGVKTVNEIIAKVEQLRRIISLPENDAEAYFRNYTKTDLYDLICMPENQEKVLKYVSFYDTDISNLGLSSRARNQLMNNGYERFSDIIFLNEADLYNMQSVGKTSVQNFIEIRNRWLSAHEKRIRAVISGGVNGDQTIYNDDEIVEMILLIFSKNNAVGFKQEDFIADLPAGISKEQIQTALNRLVDEQKVKREGELYCRQYPFFLDMVKACKVLSERDRNIIMQRLKGMTLEAIALQHGLTRERIRQVMTEKVKRVRSWMVNTYNFSLFREDLYGHFFKEYHVKKDVALEIGFSSASWYYLDSVDKNSGTKPLSTALNDSSLDQDLRTRITDYLNRDKICIDGQWCSRKRSELEKYIVEKYCVKDTRFKDFVKIYNNVLKSNNVAYDGDIYITKSVLKTRINSLVEARFLLWKIGETLRAYDVDGRDFSGLIEGLELDKFTNVEISTKKLMIEHPDLMRKYDIRDQYELHNLLRKIVPEGSFHNFHLGRMPVIGFGKFDRDAAIFELFKKHAPISMNDLSEIISWEYGYDIATIKGTYLDVLKDYSYMGVYRLEQKIMPEERMKEFMALLDQDFYYISELKQLYFDKIPFAHPDEINPFNLKKMNFTLSNNVALRNYPNLYEYFKKILTSSDIMNIKEIRHRYAQVQAFYTTLSDLKHRRDVVEFEPNRLITISRLEEAGITRDDLNCFCDAVYINSDIDNYFVFNSTFMRHAQIFFLEQMDGDKDKLKALDSEVIHKLDMLERIFQGFKEFLKKTDFIHLFEYFCDSLLNSDDRFQTGRVLNSYMFRRRKLSSMSDEKVTVISFIRYLVSKKGKLSVGELEKYLCQAYGCTVQNRKKDLIDKAVGEGIYYDENKDFLCCSTDSGD